MTPGTFCLGPDYAVALPAIDGANAGGPERHLGIDTAASADRRVQLPGAVVSTLATLFARCAALGAPAGFVEEPPASVELLLPRAKNEGGAALGANYLFVGVGQRMPSSCGEKSFQ